MTELCYEAKLARRAKQGDKTALNMLFASIFPYAAGTLAQPTLAALRQAGVRVEGNGQRVRDAVHTVAVDAVLSAVERIEEFNPKKSGFRTWVVNRGKAILYRSLQSEWPELRRPAAKDRPLSRLSPPEPRRSDDAVLEAISRHELAERITTVLAELCPSQRTALVLYYLVLADTARGHRIADAAALSDCTPQTFAARLARAREQFKKRWERRYGRLAFNMLSS